MPVELNHVIFRAKDKWASARFLAAILGMEAGPEWGRFVPVRVANGVRIDFADTPEPPPQHYAFLVGDAGFDAALTRIRDAGCAFYLTLTARGAVKSTIFMAVVESISRTWTAICWN